MQQLKEGLKAGDLEGVVNKRFSVDQYKSKMGDDRNIMVLAFTVDDLGIDVEVEAGETSELVFTFDEPGTYDFICLPHESLGMVGQIIVQ